MPRNVAGYSPVQVLLHWSVVFLVAFQFFAHDAMEESWRAFLRGEAADAEEAPLTYLHIVSGSLILLMALVRIYLRFTRGAPPPPADEPRLQQIVSELVHKLIYLLLLLMPASGAVAWFLGVSGAGAAHGLMANLLLVAIALHVAGALFQHFVRRSDVMMRMLRFERN